MAKRAKNEPREDICELISGAVAALGAGKLRIFGESPLPVQGNPAKRPPHYAVQSHSHPEAIFALSPNQEIHAGGRWQRFPAGEMWLFLPHAPHTERNLNQKKGYNLLWVSFSNLTIGTHVTFWRPESGYAVREPRLAFHTTIHESLVKHMPEKPGERQERFQGLLIESLCQALDQIGDNAGEASENSYREQMVHLVQEHIHKYFATDLNLDQLADLAHYTPSHLNQIFREQVGQTIHQYIINLRLRAAARRLRTSNDQIKQIALELGFHDPLYFSRTFHNYCGMSPTDYRNCT